MTLDEKLKEIDESFKKLSPEEVKKARKAADEVQEWFDSNPFVIPSLLTSPDKLESKMLLYFGDTVREFGECFEMSSFETVQFFQLYKKRLMDALMKGSAESMESKPKKKNKKPPYKPKQPKKPGWLNSDNMAALKKFKKK